jgi:hypothetical protein
MLLRLIKEGKHDLLDHNGLVISDRADDIMSHYFRNDGFHNGDNDAVRFKCSCGAFVVLLRESTPIARFVNPVYFANGNPDQCDYEIVKDIIT